MSPEMIGLIGFGFLFLLMYLGMPIGFCMALTGFLGNVFLFGWKGGISQLGMVPYATVASFTLSIIPLFMLMGNLSFAAGLSENAYSFVYRLFGHLRGGLAMATVGACAIFAACTGNSIAAATTMAHVAMPEMRKYKYSPVLATGSIAAGGTLGMLIPPSAPLILYSILTGASIGRLWLAGILPGMLLIFLFCITISIVTKVKPEMGPAGERATFHDLLRGAAAMWKVALLVGIVLGGLWGGFFTPSQAGAVGSTIALLILIAKRKRQSIGDIITALRGTVKSVAMIFMMVIGAMILGDFMTASQLPAYLVKIITDYQLSPMLVIIALMGAYIILGAFTDELAIALITIPILMPALEAMNINTVWFSILLVINQQMGMILPPVGILVFILAGMIEDVPMYSIYRGILPFALAMLVAIVLIMLIPQIALLLPNLLMPSKLI
ncbi:MAG TPA: TRAP transporter large permease [Syntrophorhabdaceae bacterium]|nr:TRAP transporter large permease [Syntrophorhabdaceae bacterium]